MTVAEQVGLERPRRDCHERRPSPPSPGAEVKQETGGATEEQNWTQTGTWQIFPGGRQKIAEQAEQCIKGRMPVRFRTGERPEISQDLGVEEQLGAGIDLIGTRTRCSDLLHQLESGWGWGPPCCEPGRIAKGTEPLPQAGLAAERITLVPDDRQAWLSGQHERQGC